MTSHSDTALASILLTTHLLSEEVRPFSSVEFWRFLETSPDPSRLLGLGASEIRDLTLFDEVEAERIARLLDRATGLAVEMEKLEASGLQILSVFDDSYPQRLHEKLGAGAPPLLYVVGPADLLQRQGVGIVGSRIVGTEAREVAADAARASVRQGLPVISGVAKGIDQVAMSAALEVEGSVVGLPADSLNKLVRDPSVRRAVIDERLCLATPYNPSAGFSVGNAMGRNKLIYALAKVTFVVTSDAGAGGTWAGATEALERYRLPVAVWTGVGAGPGNEKLVAAGGIAVGDAAEVPELDVPADDAPGVVGEAQQRLWG